MASLFTADFPPYTVFPLREGEYYIAGGGGTAKTGVPNALEIRSFVYDGRGFVSHQVHRHDMVDQLIMNSHPHPTDLCTIAVGVGAECKFLTASDEGKSSAGASSVEELKNVCLEVKGSVKTDFASGADCYQKAVRFCHDGSRVVTGGMEGVVRVWKYPALKQLFELKGHKSEIEAISCHPSEYKAVSVCRGGVLCAWDLVQGSREQQITWSPARSPEYRFRSCCYSVEKEKGGSHVYLFSISIPIKWNQRRKQACYVIKWNTSTWREVARQKTGKELLSAMAISSSGQHIGIGSAEGTVTIYSRNLKLLTRVPHMHGFVVTSLAFVLAKDAVTSSKGSGAVPSSSREALLSISADKSCCATTAADGKDGSTCGCSLSMGIFILLPLFCLLVSVLVMWALVV